MSLRDRFRTVLDRAKGSAGWYAAKDHPADGGITGEDYPDQSDE